MSKVRGGPAVQVNKNVPYKPPKPKKPAAQNYFPSADITPGDLSSLRRNASSTVQGIYKATPLPSLQSYQQPFIDASTREAKLGNDMLAAIGGAAQYSQGTSQGLSDWITKNVGVAQQQAQAANTGGPTVPAYTTAAATAEPIQSYGTSQTQALNALAPYVTASAQQYQGNITKAQYKALGEYNTAASTRTSQIASDVEDQYNKGLTALQTSRQNVTKNAIAEYIALTSAGYKAKDAAEKVRLDTANILRDQRAGDINQQNADSRGVTAAASDYRAHHPSAAGNKSNEVQAQKDAVKAYGTAPEGSTTSSVSGYDHTVKISYLKPTTNSLGITGAPTRTTTTITIPTATQDTGAGIQSAFKQWLAKHSKQFPGAQFVSATSGTPQKTPGFSQHYGPGKGTNWQNAVTAYAARHTPNAGETPAHYRERMAKAVEKFLPRPKA